MSTGLEKGQQTPPPSAMVKNSQEMTLGILSSLSSESLPPMRSQVFSTKSMREEIPDENIWLTIAHIANAFASGAIDVASFYAWENFTCMQTGNSVFTIMRLVLPQSFQGSWLDPLVSIVAFVIGSICFGTLMRTLSMQRRANRAALVTSQAIQASMILLVAILCFTDVLPHERQSMRLLDGYHIRKFIAIILLSFQASGQLVTSRELRRPELPTVVLTASYVDLFADKNLLKKNNSRRNGLVLQVIAIFLGFFCGAKSSEHPRQMPIVLFIGFAVKTLICIAWASLLGKPPSPPKEEDLEKSVAIVGIPSD